MHRLTNHGGQEREKRQNDRRRESESKPKNGTVVKRAASPRSSSRSKHPEIMSLRIQYHRPSITQMLRQDKKRRDLLVKLYRSRLRKHYMMGEAPEEVEMDLVRMFSVDAFGDSNNYRVWVDIKLGEQRHGITEHEVLFDTASALTWVTKESYIDTRNTNQRALLQPPAAQREEVALSYSSLPDMVLSGKLYQDTLRLGNPTATVDRQLFGVIDNVPENIAPQVTDGIIGCGPKRLTRGTLPRRPNARIDTVLDNLFKQRGIASHVVGIALRPIDDTRPDIEDAVMISGFIHIGGYRRHHNDPPLASIPVTLISGRMNFYGVNLTLTLGTNTTILDNKAGILDTGSSFIYLERRYLDRYMTRLGADYDQNVEMWYIQKTDKNKLRDLKFGFDGGVEFIFPPGAQIWPPTLNTRLHPNARSDRIYFTLKELTSQAEGRTFIIGLAWVCRYYVGIDLSEPTNPKIDIGYTSHTNSQWLGL